MSAPTNLEPKSGQFLSGLYLTLFPSLSSPSSSPLPPHPACATLPNSNLDLSDTIPIYDQPTYDPRTCHSLVEFPAPGEALFLGIEIINPKLRSCSLLVEFEDYAFGPGGQSGVVANHDTGVRLNRMSVVLRPAAEMYDPMIGIEADTIILQVPHRLTSEKLPHSGFTVRFHRLGEVFSGRQVQFGYVHQDPLEASWATASFEYVTKAILRQRGYLTSKDVVVEDPSYTNYPHRRSEFPGRCVASQEGGWEPAYECYNFVNPSLHQQQQRRLQENKAFQRHHDLLNGGGGTPQRPPYGFVKRPPSLSVPFTSTTPSASTSTSSTSATTTVPLDDFDANANAKSTALQQYKRTLEANISLYKELIEGDEISALIEVERELKEKVEKLGLAYVG